MSVTRAALEVEIARFPHFGGLFGNRLDGYSNQTPQLYLIPLSQAGQAIIHLPCELRTPDPPSKKGVFRQVG